MPRLSFTPLTGIELPWIGCFDFTGYPIELFSVDRFRDLVNINLDRGTIGDNLSCQVCFKSLLSSTEMGRVLLSNLSWCIQRRCEICLPCFCWVSTLVYIRANGLFPWAGVGHASHLLVLPPKKDPQSRSLRNRRPTFGIPFHICPFLFFAAALPPSFSHPPPTPSTPFSS